MININKEVPFNLYIRLVLCKTKWIIVTYGVIRINNVPFGPLLIL